MHALIIFSSTIAYMIVSKHIVTANLFGILEGIEDKKWCLAKHVIQPSDIDG